MVHRQFPYRKISPTSLRAIYKKHKIKKKSVLIKKQGSKKVMGKIAAMKEEAQEAIEYARELDLDIVYLDEYMLTTR